MNVAKLKKKLMKTATKVAQKFRRGDHEKGFIGAGAGASLIALGSIGYLGNTINKMITSISNGTTVQGSGTTNIAGIAGFVNDVVALIGLISLILGIIEYRKLRKQVVKK